MAQFLANRRSVDQEHDTGGRRLNLCCVGANNVRVFDDAAVVLRAQTEVVGRLGFEARQREGPVSARRHGRCGRRVGRDRLEVRGRRRLQAQIGVGRPVVAGREEVAPRRDRRVGGDRGLALRRGICPLRRVRDDRAVRRAGHARAEVRRHGLEDGRHVVGRRDAHVVGRVR